jgi:hypothetical protein
MYGFSGKKSRITHHEVTLWLKRILVGARLEERGIERWMMC